MRPLSGVHSIFFKTTRLICFQAAFQTRGQDTDCVFVSHFPMGVLWTNLNAIFFHTDKEAAGKLRATCSSVEEGWGGMSEPAL